MRRQTRPGGGRQIEVTIEAIGARGDGTGTHDGQPIFVPFTLPGDRVLARLAGRHAGGLRAEAIELLSEGPHRIQPPCPHFGTCGGCTVQHLADAQYVDWKRSLLTHALGQRGIAEAPVAPLRRVGAGARRRVVLAAAKVGGRLCLGLHQRASHKIVDLETCLVLTPNLMTLLPPVRRTLADVLADGETAEVALTETEAGADVLILSGAALSLAAREALADLAQSADLARLSWGVPPRGGEEVSPEPIAIRRPPRVRFGAVAVEPPPGGFLQPTLDGQQVLTDAILAGIPEGAARVADLYAGCGTFTFALAGRHRVHAVEGDSAALAALWAAARRADLAGRVTVEQRDLARDPLGVEELNVYDTVVFDPPRTGAREQAAALAASTVPVVIAVSCSPGSFARDARTLIDGGYTLVEAIPVDQFPWSGHLELVARFVR